MLARNARHTSVNAAVEYGVGQIAHADVPHTGQRAVDATQHVGDADRGGRPGQLVAAVAAALAAHQSVGAQIGQDVDEELRRNALRGRYFVGLDQGAGLGGGQVDHRSHRVLRLGRHAHCEHSSIWRVS